MGAASMSTCPQCHVRNQTTAAARQCALCGFDASGGSGRHDGEAKNGMDAPSLAVHARAHTHAHAQPHDIALRTVPAPTDTTDILFSFDMTSSMSAAAAAVRRNIASSVDHLFQSAPGIRIGIIAHGDYCDEMSGRCAGGPHGGPHVLKSLDFSRSKTAIKAFLDACQQTSGGPFDECYELVLRHAQDLDWRGHRRALLLIGDAWPHPRDFEGNVGHLAWESELEVLTGVFGVEVHGLQFISKQQPDTPAATGAGGDAASVARDPSPYSKHKGQTHFDESIPRDRFGNVIGRNGEFDLCPDNAFKGEQIAVMQLCDDGGAEGGANRGLPAVIKAMQQKGFSTHVWCAVPSAAEFAAVLQKSCQLWVISGNTAQLTPEHLALVRQHVVAQKKGLFLWGDNDPWAAEINNVLAALDQTRGVTMRWNQGGHCQVIRPTDRPHDRNGFSSTHPIFTGIESLYEGHTVGHIQGGTRLEPLLRGSDGGLVTATYDQHGERVIVDGGFTRMYPEFWAETAGTSRFVINAACWLFNWEGRVKPALQRERRDQCGRFWSELARAGRGQLFTLQLSPTMPERGFAEAAKLFELFCAAYAGEDALQECIGALAKEPASANAEALDQRKRWFQQLAVVTAAAAAAAPLAKGLRDVLTDR